MIHSLLRKNDTLVVFDTNVYLNLYDYSPYVAEFFLELIENIEEKIIMPSTVKREFSKNHISCYGRQKKKFSDVPSKLKKSTESIKTKMFNQIAIWEKLKFPNLDNLKDFIDDKISDLETAFDNYIDENDIFDEMNKKYFSNDVILSLVERVISGDRFVADPTVEELYKICEEGKKRYQREIPPGFMDDKDKDGIDKYNDLIIWFQSINYCKENSKNLIFVTDDLKRDWWENPDNITPKFHSSLVEEFKQKSNHEVIGLSSFDFFSNLANEMGVSIPDELAGFIKYSAEDYIKGVFEEYDIIEQLSEELYYSIEMYVDTYSISYWTGNIEMSGEIKTIRPLSFSCEGYKDGKAVYVGDVEIVVDAYTRECGGKGEDKEEAIFSNTHLHELKGNLKIRINRSVDSYLEDLVYDYFVNSVEIVDGNLIEISVSRDLCVKCGLNTGEVPFKGHGVICVDCATIDRYGDICPKCGEKVPYEFMGGSGFCRDCEIKYDDI